MAGGLWLEESKQTPNLWDIARDTLVPGWGPVPTRGEGSHPQMARRSLRCFLEEDSVCPGASLSWAGHLPKTSCLGVIPVSPSHAPDTVGSLFPSSYTP